MGLKIEIDKYGKHDKNDILHLGFGIILWKHSHYVKIHYHLIIDFLFWYIQFTWGENE